MSTKESPNSWKRGRFQGWESWHAWIVALHAANDEPTYKKKLDIFRVMRIDGYKAPRLIIARYWDHALEMTRERESGYIYLNKADRQELYDHFMNEYREECAYLDKKEGV